MAADSADSDATAPAGAAALGRLREEGRGDRGEPAGFRAVAPGDRLGRYEVRAAIGEGGMATVFRARDPELRRDVAIKVLFPHLSRRREVVQRFQREARAAARLRHPAILQTYDVGGGEGGEPPYIVMELVEGTSLDEHVAERGPLLGELVACAGVVVAEALAVAHQAGVIHRDLKPSNLLVCDDGRLLLADFGVARVERDESLATKTGAVLGTPAYMSPEQASGDDVDARSDVYSLGATLYHLATGAAPYSGSAMKVMSQLATPGALVPPLKRRPAVGRPLSTAIAQLMALEVDQRPASAQEAAARLRPVMQGLEGAAGPAGPAGSAGGPSASEELAAYFRAPEDYVERVLPRVVDSLVAEGMRAQREGKLAAAMAAADRASALAPDDEAVRALVKAVTSRQSAGRRWKLAALAGMPVAALAVGAAVLLGRADAPTQEGATDAAMASGDAAVEAAMASFAARGDGEAAGSGGARAGSEAGSESRSVSGSESGSGSESELGSGSRSGSGSESGLGSASRSGSDTRSAATYATGPVATSSPPRASSSSTPSTAPSRSGSPALTNGASAAAPVGTAATAAPSSATAAPSPATAPLPSSDVAPAALPASVTFAMDAWCELSIDGKPYGRADRNRAVPLPAGKHVAECTQGANLGSWRGELELTAGETRRVTGELRMEVAVTIEVSGTGIALDGKTYANRERLALRNGRHHVTVRGPAGELASGWVSVPRVARCTLRDEPVLDCYP